MRRWGPARAVSVAGQSLPGRKSRALPPPSARISVFLSTRTRLRPRTRRSPVRLIRGLLPSRMTTRPRPRSEARATSIVPIRIKKSCPLSTRSRPRRKGPSTSTGRISVAAGPDQSTIRTAINPRRAKGARYPRKIASPNWLSTASFIGTTGRCASRSSKRVSGSRTSTSIMRWNALKPRTQPGKRLLPLASPCGTASGSSLPRRSSSSCCNSRRSNSSRSRRRRDEADVAGEVGRRRFRTCLLCSPASLQWRWSWIRRHRSPQQIQKVTRYLAASLSQAFNPIPNSYTTLSRPLPAFSEKQSIPSRR